MSNVIDPNGNFLVAIYASTKNDADFGKTQPLYTLRDKVEKLADLFRNRANMGHPQQFLAGEQLSRTDMHVKPMTLITVRVPSHVKRDFKAAVRSLSVLDSGKLVVGEVEPNIALRPVAILSTLMKSVLL